MRPATPPDDRARPPRSVPTRPSPRPWARATDSASRRRVPAIRRLLLALVAAAVLAPVGPAAAASPAPVAPAPPRVTLVGLAISGVDSGTILLATDEAGSASLQLAPGTAPGPVPVGYVIERPGQPAYLADGQPSSLASDETTPDDSGSDWALPVGQTASSTLFVRWIAGARPIEIDVRAVGPDGSLSAPTAVDLVPASAAGTPSSLAARLHGGSITLAWRETGAVAIAGRALLIDTAPLVAGACAKWHAASAARLPDPAPAVAAVASDSLVARAFEHDAPPEAEPVGVTSVPVTAAVMPRTLALTGPALAPDASGSRLSMLVRATGGTCYRFTVRLVDALGRVTSRRSARVVVPILPGRHDVAWAGSLDLYRPGTFATQATWKWCIAASTEMMVNLVRHRTGDSAAAQRAIITWAKAHDVGNYGKKGGTDTVGWSRALAYFGAGRYQVVTAGSLAEALRIAATAIRRTGRPVGITVADGRHAWVLHGFSSAVDPLTDAHARISAVWISGPLWPRQTTAGYDPQPDTKVTAGRLAGFYTPYATAKGKSTGRWMLVIPVR